MVSSPDLWRSVRKRFGHRQSRSAFTLVELVVVIVIIAASFLIVFRDGCSIRTIEKANQIRDLSNTKQIYLGLKMYAGDHNGRFPDKTMHGGELTNANEAYRQLIPKYFAEEKIFRCSQSAWTQNPPDGDVREGKALAAGENHFAYVANLAEKSNPSFPLIADGFKEGEPGTYTSDVKAKGGAWKGKAAVVMRVDGSAKIE